MNRPHRILMTIDAVGGVWQYGVELAAALAPLGHETVLALLGPAPSAAQRAQVAAAPGVTLIETGLPLDWLAADAHEVARTAHALGELAASLRVDAVQINQPAIAACFEGAMPLVVVAHSCVGTWWRAVRGDEAEPASFGWQTALVARGLARADAVACPSAAFARDLQARYGLPHMPMAVHPGRSPLTTPTGALHDFAFTAGRLWDEGKNIATLDRAAAALGVPFKAAGSLVGPNGEQVVLYHLHPLGAVDERAIGDCLAARPVFVSAARYEPFGLAVLEAAMAGCALILSDIATFREIWGDAALFVAPGDAAGFAGAVEELVGDIPLRLARGDLARRRAARYSPRRMAARMADIYARLPTNRVAA